MNLRPHSLVLKQLVDDRAWDSDFYLIDVGASGGIAPHWSAFGDKLRAVGFDPLVAEVDRLNGLERRPGVRYEAAFVGCSGFDDLFAPGLRNDRVRSRNNDVFPRVSAARAQEILSMDYVRDVFNRGDAARIADRTIALDDFVPEHEYAAVDFVKIDTDGHDIEVLLGADRLLRGGVIGLLVECQFHGPVHPYANTFANIDAYLRDRGFSLFDIETYRYSRSALPAPFVYDIPAQTESGQLLWGDALYLRDLGDPSYEAKHRFPVTKEQVLKLAGLFALFGLTDCAAELLVTRAHAVAEPLRSSLLNIMPEDVGVTGLDYAGYLRSFERDPRGFYPSTRKRKEEEVAARSEPAPAEVAPPPPVSPPPPLPPPSAAPVLDERIPAIRAENERLKARLQELKDRNERLRQKLEAKPARKAPASSRSRE